MSLDSLQIKPDPDEQQMPKRSISRQEERTRSMMGTRKTAAKPKRATGGQGKAATAAVSSDTGARRGGKPITIPLTDVSPELKAILVREMIKGGRTKVVKGKGKGKGKGEGK